MLDMHWIIQSMKKHYGAMGKTRDCYKPQEAAMSDWVFDSASGANT
jgi:hypothetical protein